MYHYGCNLLISIRAMTAASAAAPSMTMAMMATSTLGAKDRAKANMAYIPMATIATRRRP